MHDLRVIAGDVDAGTFGGNARVATQPDPGVVTAEMRGTRIVVVDFAAAVQRDRQVVARPGNTGLAPVQRGFARDGNSVLPAGNVQRPVRAVRGTVYLAIMADRDVLPLLRG
ncbi:hypothetical protein DAI18_13140 [Microvirgula aerodenitrificans]|uniref:Uncharacterized protein n=1 Tax=Microvirgula aerodenitrificans TaxID=57480 RepID=A0A2S0PBW9_9NEIS|nr:hypothetical protein DAI18_13140 [Microvirgula aerodenitrificans]